MAAAPLLADQENPGRVRRSYPVIAIVVCAVFVVFSSVVVIDMHDLLIDLLIDGEPVVIRRLRPR